jgi:hypothetical protein
MTHRSANINARSDVRMRAVVLCKFTPALLWWIGIAGVVTSGGGALVFLAIPALATIGTALVGHQRRSHPAMQKGVKRSRNTPPSGTGYPIVILCGFTTALREGGLSMPELRSPRSASRPRTICASRAKNTAASGSSSGSHPR